MVSSSSTLPRRQRPNGATVFDPPASCLRDALTEDFRAACKRYEGVPQQIARRHGVTPDWVYKWFELDSHKLNDEEIETIVSVTGGATTHAYLRHLSAHSACQGPQDRDVSVGVSEIVLSIAALNRQVADDMAPDDDTPGRFDRRELVRLRSMLEQVQTDTSRLSAILESLQEQTR